MSFKVVLKNEKTRQYDRMAQFILLLNVPIFIMAFIYTSESRLQVLALTGAILAAAALTGDYFLAKAGKKKAKLKLAGLLVVAAAWGLMDIWWACLPCLLLVLLFRVSGRELEVGVEKEAVMYPSFPRRAIRWNELSNLILKDGLLTIDFKNNKILQSEIKEEPSGVDEGAFNEFCRQQLQ